MLKFSMGIGLNYIQLPPDAPSFLPIEILGYTVGLELA